MNRYRVRISVTEHKPGFGIVAAVGGTVPDKLLDASFTTDNLHEIRHCVDGLIAEGVPETQQSPLFSRTKHVSAPLPPTVAESGDLNVSDTTIEAVRRVGEWLPSGGKRCAEPDAPDDTPPPVDTTAS